MPEKNVKELIHIIYASNATTPLSGPDLTEILRVSRNNNGTAGVTGMLLHTEGSFFQVLEGSREAVEDVFARIATDARHRDVVTIIRERIAKRAFAEWSMGFAEVSRAQIAALSGANDFFHDGACFDALSAGRAKKLLLAFRDRRWRTSETTRASA